MGFHDMEQFHLNKVLVKLWGNQPKPKPKRISRPKSDIPQSGIKGVTWDRSQGDKGMWSVSIMFNGVKRFCGRTDFKEFGPTMQDEKRQQLELIELMG